MGNREAVYRRTAVTIAPTQWGHTEVRRRIHKLGPKGDRLG